MCYLIFIYIKSHLICFKKKLTFFCSFRSSSIHCCLEFGGIWNVINLSFKVRKILLRRTLTGVDQEKKNKPWSLLPSAYPSWDFHKNTQRGWGTVSYHLHGSTVGERIQGVELENVRKHGRCVTSGLLILASAEDLLRGLMGRASLIPIHYYVMVTSRSKRW